MRPQGQDPVLLCHISRSLSLRVLEGEAQLGVGELLIAFAQQADQLRLEDGLQKTVGIALMEDEEIILPGAGEATPAWGSQWGTRLVPTSARAELRYPGGTRSTPSKFGGRLSWKTPWHPRLYLWGAPSPWLGARVPLRVRGWGQWGTEMPVELVGEARAKGRTSARHRSPPAAPPSS